MEPEKGRATCEVRYLVTRLPEHREVLRVPLGCRGGGGVSFQLSLEVWVGVCLKHMGMWRVSSNEKPVLPINISLQKKLKKKQHKQLARKR